MGMEIEVREVLIVKGKKAVLSFWKGCTAYKGWMVEGRRLGLGFIHLIILGNNKSRLYVSFASPHR